MCITKEIIHWIEDQDNELIHGDGDMNYSWYAKVVGLGVLEGAIDGALLCGVACVTSGIIKCITGK